MNEITIHGNVTADPVLRFGRDGDATAFLAFTVAVNRFYFDRARNAKVEQPAIFHEVVAFRGLAENAAASLAKGTAVSLRWATAEVTRKTAGDRRITETQTAPELAAAAS